MKKFIKQTFFGGILCTFGVSLVSAEELSELEQAELEQIAHSVTYFADRGEFDSLENLLATEVTVDYSSLFGGGEEKIPAAELMDSWETYLSGFDLTDHKLGEITLTQDGSRVIAKSSIESRHWLDSVKWTIGGENEFTFTRANGQWLIDSLKFKLQEETGPRSVIQKALLLSKRDEAPRRLRRRAKQAVLDFLGGLEDKDMDRVNGVWALNAVQDMPYATLGTPRRVEGRDALIELYSGWPEAAENPDFTSDLKFYETRNPKELFVEYTGTVQIVPTGLVYNQTYCGFFRINTQGQIELFREYYDPREFKRAFAIPTPDSENK